ncbi:MAG: hypothetical protein WD926_00455 [Patescibacteria group bacterium]
MATMGRKLYRRATGRGRRSTGEGVVSSLDFLDQIGDGAKLFGRYLLMGLGLLIILYLLLTNTTFALTIILAGGAGFMLFKNRRGEAAVLMLALAALGLLGYFSGIFAGGVTGGAVPEGFEADDRGFVMAWMGFATVALAFCYQIRYDWLAGLATALFLGLIAVLWNLLGFGLSVGAGGVALLIVTLLCYLLLSAWLTGKVLHILKSVAGTRPRDRTSLRRPGIIAGAIVIATYVSSVLFFGDTTDPTSMGLTVWKDGRFDQLFYGTLLAVLAVTIAVVGVSPQEWFKPANDREREFSDGLEEHLDEWADLTPEQRELVIVFWPFQRKHRLLEVGQDKFVPEALGKADVTEQEVTDAGLDIDTIRLWLGRKFAADAVVAGIVRQNGRLLKARLDEIGVENEAIEVENELTKHDYQEVVRRSR